MTDDHFGKVLSELIPNCINIKGGTKYLLNMSNELIISMLLINNFLEKELVLGRN